MKPTHSLILDQLEALPPFSWDHCFDTLGSLLHMGCTMACALVIAGLLCYSLYKLIKIFLTMLFIKGGFRSEAKRSSLFISCILLTFFSGALIYYIGYDYAGTEKNPITLLLRSALSSFEMFLSKSNLIGIADNCKASAWYMFCFSVTHTLAVVLSTIFAVTCFSKRILHWLRGIWWIYGKSADAVDVFWGLNERSYMLARDIYKSQKDGFNDHIVFVDFPEETQQPASGQSFSGLLGLFSYKINVIRQISNINYILFRCSYRPSECREKGRDFFDVMNLRRLERILKNTHVRRFFVFTDNESANLRAAINMLDMCGKKFSPIVYSSARRTPLTKLLEEKYAGKLHIIDDSRTAVATLKRQEVEYSNPIDYVTVNKDDASVTSVFTALIIGFGATGQDALRFLYEFSSFPGADGKKSKVKIHVVDNKMRQLEGEFLQEVPAMEFLAGKDREIVLHHMDIGSKEYFELQRSIIKDLNYAIIAIGDDTRNIEIASRLLEMANQHKDNTLRQFRVFVRLYKEENREKFDAAADVYTPFSLSLSYFGSTQSLYTRDLIISDRIKEDAEEFHKAYCEANENEKYVPFEKRFDQECQNSKVGPLYAYRSLERKESQNEANSMHVYTKMKLLGLTENPNTVALPKWDEQNGLSQSAINKAWITRLINASICEHLRWNAFHLMMGYLPMTDKVEKQTVGTCNIKSKQHYCIKDWEKLEIETQKYDYFVVRTSVYQYLKGIVKVQLKQ